MPGQLQKIGKIMLFIYVDFILNEGTFISAVTIEAVSVHFIILFMCIVLLYMVTKKYIHQNGYRLDLLSKISQQNI